MKTIHLLTRPFQSIRRVYYINISTTFFIRPLYTIPVQIPRSLHQSHPCAFWSASFFPVSFAALRPRSFSSISFVMLIRIYRFFWQCHRHIRAHFSSPQGEFFQRRRAQFRMAYDRLSPAFARRTLYEHVPPPLSLPLLRLGALSLSTYCKILLFNIVLSGSESLAIEKNR